MKEHLLDCFDRIPDNDQVLIKGYEKDIAFKVTCKEFRLKVFKIADFLKSKQISPKERVAVITEKCPEEIAVFFSIWLNGGIAVPICETLQTRELSYILKDCGAKIILCSDSLKERIELCVETQGPAVYGFSSWGECRSDGHSDTNSSARRDPDDIAFLIYTSGSTGKPKGVILTHRNIAVNAGISADYIRMRSADAVMSILPYWHSFALAAEIFTMLSVGGKIFIPRNKTALLKDAVLFKPTIILSIPKLAEMLKKGIESSLQKKSWIQRKIFKYAQSVSLKYHLRPVQKRTFFLKKAHSLMQKIVFQKVKETFGGCIRYFIGGGAPLDASLQEFFLSIDIPMYQGYGLTEASPVISINAPHDFKMGASGKIIPWLTEEYEGDYTFEDENGKRGKNIRGELLVKGKCVMKGYWNLEEETRCALKDGWLHTGDMGYIDEDGFVVLFGRKKSLLCLKGGEKFYPEFIEEKIKTSPYIHQVMIVGEGCKRCSVIININPDLADKYSREDIDGIIAGEIRRLTKDLESYQRPIRHFILPEFTAEEGLLTNTQKIRRHKVFEKYGKEIEDLLVE